VLAALRDLRLQAGVPDPEWHAQYRQEAAARFRAFAKRESEIETSAAGCLSRLVGTVDVCEEVVRPWASDVATTVTGASGLQSLTADVFAGATDSFNTDLKRNSDEATRTIASHFSGDSAASLWVQAFVALSESLPAFVVNSWYTLLRSDSPS
jgi:hypothetical protein